MELELWKKAEVRRTMKKKIVDQDLTEETVLEAIGIFNSTNAYPSIADVARFIYEDFPKTLNNTNTKYSRLRAIILDLVAQGKIIKTNFDKSKTALSLVKIEPDPLITPVKRGRKQTPEYKKRNKEILALYRQGKSRHEIANEMGLSYDIVKNCIYLHGRNIKPVTEVKTVKAKKTYKIDKLPQKVGLIRRFWRWLF